MFHGDVPRGTKIVFSVFHEHLLFTLILNSVLHYWLSMYLSYSFTLNNLALLTQVRYKIYKNLNLFKNNMIGSQLITF
jgi:hypothetical protein